MTTIFQPIFDASLLSKSVIVTLQKWFPTYLEELRIQRNETSALPEPRAYLTRNEFTSFPDESMPMVVAVSPGTVSEPMRDGDGRYSAWYGLGLGIVAAANTESNSDRVAKEYAAVARTILLQKQGLDGAWEYGGIEWADEGFDDLPDPAQERTMRASLLMFRVLVYNVSTKFAGPAHPVEPGPEQPGSDWPTVESTEIEVEVIPHG